MEKKEAKEAKEKKEKKIDYLKNTKELLIHYINEIESVGYDFQWLGANEVGANEVGANEVGAKPTADANELYAIIEIEQQCRNLKILINNFYLNKIESL